MLTKHFLIRNMQVCENPSCDILDRSAVSINYFGRELRFYCLSTDLSTGCLQCHKSYLQFDQTFIFHTGEN